MEQALFVRPGRDEDSAGVIEVVARCYADYPGCVLDVEAEEPELLAPASAFAGFWVVERGGEVAGCVAFDAGPPPLLKKMYLLPELRGRGLANELEGRVVDAARATGATRIELWTDTRFTRAHAFYGKLGWRPTGRTRELHDLSKTTEYHYVKDLRFLPGGVSPA